MDNFLDLVADPAFISWVLTLPFIFLYFFSPTWRKRPFLHSIVGVTVGGVTALLEGIHDYKNWIGLPLVILIFLIIGFFVGLITQTLVSVAFPPGKSLLPRSVTRAVFLLLLIGWQLLFILKISWLSLAHVIGC